MNSKMDYIAPESEELFVAIRESCLVVGSSNEPGGEIDEQEEIELG